MVGIDGSFLAAGAVVSLGALIQSVTGFGFAMFAAPLLALVSPALVPVPILILTIVFTLGTVWEERRYIDWRGLGWILAGRLPLTGLAAVAMAFVSPTMITIIFCVFVLVAVALSLNGVSIGVSRRNLLLAGAASGFFGTITSIGAPPLALVYQNQKGPMVRATLGANIVIGCTVSIAALALTGKVTQTSLVVGLGYIPFAAIGYVIAGRIRQKLTDASFRKYLLLVTGAATVLIGLKEIAQLAT